MSLEQIFMSLIGILLFMSGINGIQNAFLKKGKLRYVEGKVVDATLRSEKDEKDRLIRHYYSLSVNYFDTSHKSIGLKSTKEYKENDPITLAISEDAVSIAEMRNHPYSGIALFAAGVILIVATVFYKSYGALFASAAVSAVFLCIACSIYLAWYNDHSLHLTRTKGKIVDILIFQKENSQRRLFKTVEKYPLVEYQRNNKTYHFLSKNIAHTDDKIGKEVTFFTDRTGLYKTENSAGTLTLCVSIVVACIGIWGVVSTILQIGGNL